MFKILLGLASIFVSTSALATAYRGHISFFTQFHFDRFAYGKEVKAVFAHAGILTIAYPGAPNKTWKNIQHFSLVKQSDSFSNVLTFEGPRSSHGEHSENVVVQYWVYFTDGSELVTESFVVPNTYDTVCHDALADSPRCENRKMELGRTLQHAPVLKTQSVSVEVGHAS